MTVIRVCYYVLITRDFQQSNSSFLPTSLHRPITPTIVHHFGLLLRSWKLFPCLCFLNGFIFARTILLYSTCYLTILLYPWEMSESDRTLINTFPIRKGFIIPSIILWLSILTTALFSTILFTFILFKLKYYMI